MVYNKYIKYERRIDMSQNVQVNIAIPKEWKTQLENLALIYSVEENKQISFLDLMRQGIKEKYQLEDEI